MSVRAMPISLQINCGFQLTSKQGIVDTHKRKTEFKQLFESCSNLGKPGNYFGSNSDRHSAFDRHCNPVSLDNNIMRKLSQWRQKHTLANCKQCDTVQHELETKLPIRTPLQKESSALN